MIGSLFSGAGRLVFGIRWTLRIPNREVADSLYDGYIAQVFGTDFEIDDFEDDAEKIR